MWPRLAVSSFAVDFQYWLTSTIASITLELCLSGFGHRQALKLRHCGFFGDALDQRDFSRQAIKRGSVQLAFAIALFGIERPSAEIAHYFRYRDDAAGFDLGFIFFGQSKPAGPSRRSRPQQGLSNVLDNGGAGQLAYADAFGLLR